MDFRRSRPNYTPLLINNTAVEVMGNTKFLGLHITDNLGWSLHTFYLMKKAQQRLHFLQRMRRPSLPPPILSTTYKETIKSLLTNCISIWSGSCKASDRKSLQRVLRNSALQNSPELSRAHWILGDTTHPHHGLFSH